nr:amiloride sensitive cation channel 4 A [Hymenolepis microstoma]
MRFIEGAFLLVSILILIILLGLRFKYWRETSRNCGTAYGAQFASSNLVISSYEEKQASDVPFPYFSICNANPATGSTLFGLQPDKGKSPVWYERFLDARLARPQTSENSEDLGANNANYNLMLNHTAHSLKNMLIECRISSRTCFHTHFVKYVLPSGVCYTFQGEIKASETLHLELDPESVEYLIPNSGLVGFRFLVHETPEPHWVYHQAAVFLGAQFHTMLRLVGTRKVLETNCVPLRNWEACIDKCLMNRIQKECQCIFSARNDGCNLSSISGCSLQLDTIQDSLSLSTCNCIHPCEQTVYNYESITQAWKPFFPDFRGFWKFQSVRSRAIYNQSSLDTQTTRSISRYWFHSLNQHERDYQLTASIQLWAFLREANRKVFHELMSLDETLISLQRISKVMKRVVKIIGQAANYSRSGRSRLMKTFLQSNGKVNSAIFDENCLDQAEHTGMLAKVSQLSEAFTNRLQESFLFDMSQQSVQLNLIMILLQRSPADFSRLLNDLRISDLISDVTVLDLRRNGQKCLDAAYNLNGLLSNFSIKDLFPTSNSSSVKSGNLPTGSENIISSLQAMLLAIDSNLNKLSSEFSRLYDENKILILEMGGLLSYQSSMEHRHSRVAVTVHISPRQSQSIRLKSTETVFNKNAELLDILTSVVMVGSLLVVLAEGICSTVWECRLWPSSRISNDLVKRQLTGTVFEQNLHSSVSSPPLPQRRQRPTLADIAIPTISSALPQRATSHFVYSLPRGDEITPHTFAVKWNQLTLARPIKPSGGQEFCRQSKHLQPQPASSSSQQFRQHHKQSHPLFLDITDSTTGINSPSTSPRLPSDVV